MKRSLCPKTGLAIAMFLCLEISAAEEYTIRFHRPVEAGQEYRVQEKASNRDISLVSMHGRLVRKEEEKLDAEIDAHVRVVEVSEIGLPKRLSLTIERFAFGRNGELAESLAAGVVVTAGQEDNKTVFRVEGEPLPESTSEALGLFFNTKTEGIPEEDALLGTSEPRSVGETWDVKPEVFADFLLARGGDVDLGNIRGTVKLEDVEQVDGVECLSLRVEMSVQDASLVNPPPGAAGSFTMTIERTRLLPTDLKTGSLGYSSLMNVEMRTSFSEGPNAGMERHRKRIEASEGRIFRSQTEVERSKSGDALYRPKSVWPRAPAAVALMERAVATMSDLPMRCEYTTTAETIHGGDHMVLKYTGHTTFADGPLSRTELDGVAHLAENPIVTSEFTILTVIDGTLTWMETRVLTDGSVSVTKAPSDPGLDHAPLVGQLVSLGTAYDLEIADRSDGRVTLQGTHAEVDYPARVVLEEASGMPLEMRLGTAPEVVNVVIHGCTTLEAVPPELFTYEPPSGVRVQAAASAASPFAPPNLEPAGTPEPPDAPASTSSSPPD